MNLRKQRGMTIIEIMIVLAIVMMLMGVVVVGIGALTCGVIGGRNKTAGEAQLVEYLGPEGLAKVKRYSCMNRDTNGDQYVTCTAQFKDGHDEVYDCDGHILMGVGGCKPVENKMRVDGFGGY